MKISVSIIFLLMVMVVKANQDCIWESKRPGMSIQYVSACFDGINLDSILNKIISNLNRKKSDVSVLILVNNERISFPDGKFSNFFSIGYDTLRSADDDYIFKHYRGQEQLSVTNNNGRNLFSSKKYPLDISVTNKRVKTEIGLKIIYNRDYRLGKPEWDEIIKAVIYAANNLDDIRQYQKADTVRYYYNGWYLSLVTIDTFKINKGIGKITASGPVILKETDFGSPYIVLVTTGLILFFVFLFIFKYNK